MLKSQRELDIQLGCSWQVVVGEVFSFSVDYEQVDDPTFSLYVEITTRIIKIQT